MADRRVARRFGQKLRALRVHRRISLEELAHLLGYSAHGYISELEAGKKIPTVEFVVKAARLFSITTDQLLRDELEVDFHDEHD